MKHSGRFVAYYRVSTARQGRSGLGLEAQQQAVREHLNGDKWELVAEFTEVESGKRSDRPKRRTCARPRSHRRCWYSRADSGERRSSWLAVAADG
jgi:hypothetical protein